MIRPNLMERVEHAARLYDEEVGLRVSSRRAELTPGQHDQARKLDAKAAKCRHERLVILRDLGLL